MKSNDNSFLCSPTNNLLYLLTLAGLNYSLKTLACLGTDGLGLEGTGLGLEILAFINYITAGQ